MKTNDASTSQQDVRIALAELDPLWSGLFSAEQTRILQLLIERVTIGTDGLDIRLRDNGLAQVVTEISNLAGENRETVTQ